MRVLMDAGCVVWDGFSMLLRCLNLGSIMAAGATANKTLGNLDKASEDYRESIKAREELLSHDPNDYAVRRNLMIAYGNYALLLGIPWSVNLDRPQEARIYTAKAAAMAREMVAADVELFKRETLLKDHGYMIKNQFE